MNLREIKKNLMAQKGYVEISKHTKKRLEQRGYVKGDIVTAIMNGEVVEYQGNNKIVIAGKDMDNNPIIVVIAKNGDDLMYKLVTVMPPIDPNRFKDCI